MKTFLLSIILCFSNLYVHASSVNVDSLLNILDEVIVNRDTYTLKYTEKIERFRNKLREPNLSPQKAYELNNLMFELYRPFISDSAIVYINKNIELAKQNQWKEKETYCLLKYACHLSSCGLFLEAIHVLDRIDRNVIVTKELLFQYFVTCDQIYGESSYYSKDPTLSKHYEQLCLNFKDSIRTIEHKQDEALLCKKEIWLRDQMKLEEALQINDLRLSMVNENSPTAAIVYYYRAFFMSAIAEWIRHALYFSESCMVW